MSPRPSARVLGPSPGSALNCTYVHSVFTGRDYGHIRSQCSLPIRRGVKRHRRGDILMHLF